MNFNGILHITSAPYHPATNGLAERGVQTMKTAIKKMLEGAEKGESIQTIISRFVFQYRITPHTTTGVAPCERLMKRKLNSALENLKPNNNRRRRIEEMQNEGRRTYGLGDAVWFRN